MSNQSISITFVTTSLFVPSTNPSQNVYIGDATNPQYLRYCYLTSDSLTLVQATSSVTIPLTQLYQAAISASPSLTWPPIIITQPVSSSVVHPTGSYFFVSASAETAINYQWQYQSGSSGWSNIISTGQYTGSLTNALTSSTTNIISQSMASYRCIVRNTSGATSSSVAILTVS